MKTYNEMNDTDTQQCPICKKQLQKYHWFFSRDEATMCDSCLSGIESNKKSVYE